MVLGSKSVSFGFKHLRVTGANGKKATRPCPCGFLGHYKQRCRCTPEHIARYRARISGPLLDRIDLRIEVPAVPPEALARTAGGESSPLIRRRVAEARARQLQRQGKTNARLSPPETDGYCVPDRSGADLLGQAIRRFGLSARAYHRILKVARTIADLAAQPEIGPAHLAEAIQYRRLDHT